MRKSAQNVVEIGMIALLVVISVVALWQIFGGSSVKLLGMSQVKASLSTEALKNTVLNSILNLDKKNSNYNQHRIETAGNLGELIARYKAGETSLESFLLEQIKALDPSTSSEAAKSCLSSPSSCSALMTVSDFSWSKSFSDSTPYYGGKIPLTLSYTYSYVNDSGKIVENTIYQNVSIQKEQNEANVGSPYSAFLNTYMNNTFPSSSFTGAASGVQSALDSYLSGKNCVLSKSSSQDVSFSNHRAY